MTLRSRENKIQIKITFELKGEKSEAPELNSTPHPIFACHACRDRLQKQPKHLLSCNWTISLPLLGRLCFFGCGSRGFRLLVVAVLQFGGDLSRVSCGVLVVVLLRLFLAAAFPAVSSVGQAVLLDIVLVKLIEVLVVSRHFFTNVRARLWQKFQQLFTM